MQLAGHRGTRVHAPENSLTALVSAYTAGADVLEFDVQLTADNRLVVSHDGTINRLTGEQGTIRNMSLSALRHTKGRYDFSATFNPFGVPGFRYFRPGRRLQIEIFEHLLDALPRDVMKLIELKHDSSPDDVTRRAFVSGAIGTLVERGMIDETIVYSKDPANITMARELAPSLRIAAFDWEKLAPERLDLVRQTKAHGLVTDVASVIDDGGNLTPMGEALRDMHGAGELSLGALLYPYRKPGVFTEAEFRVLASHDFVFSLSTDSMLGAEVEGTRVDVARLVGRHRDWIHEDFGGKSIDRDLWSFGYAKAGENQRYCDVEQNDGVRIDIKAYDGWLPGPETGDPVKDQFERLRLQMHYALRDWPFYSGGGVGFTPGIRGDFVAEVDYSVAKPMTQAQTLEMAVVNVDPGAHQSKHPETVRGQDAFYDPHGCPPFIGVEHDEDDGYRINWNLGTEYETNQYGPPGGDGKTPRAGRLRAVLRRR